MYGKIHLDIVNILTKAEARWRLKILEYVGEEERRFSSVKPGSSNTDNCGKACLSVQLRSDSFLAADGPTGMEAGGALFKLLTLMPLSA